MRGPALVAHQARYDIRTFWRDPAATFFTVALPVIFLVLFVALFGNEEIESLGIKGSTYYVPAIVALAVLSATFVNLGITLATQRENGVLKRVRGTPLPPSVFIAGRVATAVVISTVMAVILVVLGRILYGVSIPGAALVGFAVVLVVGAAAFSCLGIAATAIIPTEAAGPPVTNAIVLPLYFISGLFVPTEQVPEWMQTVADVFPVKPFAEALLVAFDPSTTGVGISGADLAVVVLWGLIGLALASRAFRWVPRGG